MYIEHEVYRTNDRPQGESYPEGKPSCIDYQCDIPVTLGHTPQTKIEIFANDSGKVPVHLNSSTKFIGTLSLDLGRIPESVMSGAKTIRMGLHRYYCLEGVIEARYGSAEITYTVKLGGEYLLSWARVSPTDTCAGVTHDVISVRYES